jgi:hypothetical protein
MKTLEHFIENIFFLWFAPFGSLFNVFYPVFQKRIQTHGLMVSALTIIPVFHNQCSPDQNSETLKQLPLKNIILVTLKTLATIIVLFVD